MNRSSSRIAVTVIAGISGALLLLSSPALAHHPTHHPAQIPAQSTPGCHFMLGFAQLRQLIGPDIVGDCVENERFNPISGNAEQRTEAGLLVWRKEDNWTAFTDGYRTWINGPDGVEQRLNTERFAWERDPLQTTAATSTTPESASRSAIEVVNVSTGWGPTGAAILYPSIRFTIVNRSAETVPIYSGDLLYSATFVDEANRELYGSALGVSSNIGLGGLRAGFNEEILIQSTNGYRQGTAPRPRLAVELYQGNRLTGEQRPIGTYQIGEP